MENPDNTDEADIKSNFKYHCAKCEYYTNQLNSWNIHLRAKKHLTDHLKIKSENKFHCECCNVTLYHITNW